MIQTVLGQLFCIVAHSRGISSPPYVSKLHKHDVWSGLIFDAFLSVPPECHYMCLVQVNCHREVQKWEILCCGPLAVSVRPKCPRQQQHSALHAFHSTLAWEVSSWFHCVWLCTVLSSLCASVLLASALLSLIGCIMGICHMLLSFILFCRPCCFANFIVHVLPCLVFSKLVILLNENSGMFQKACCILGPGAYSHLAMLWSVQRIDCCKFAQVQNLSWVTFSRMFSSL